MKIKILGTGCPNCIRTEAAVKVALDQLQIDAQVEKVENIMDIMKYDVMSTPAVVIDEVVKIKGRVPSIQELKDLLSTYNSENCCEEGCCEEGCCEETENSNCCENNDENSSKCC
jgi:small redox-active disulfide protein 2